MIVLGKDRYDSVAIGSTMGLVGFSLMLVVAALECRDQMDGVAPETFDNNAVNVTVLVEVALAVMIVRGGALTGLLGTVPLTGRQWLVGLIPALRSAGHLGGRASTTDARTSLPPTTTTKRSRYRTRDEHLDAACHVERPLAVGADDLLDLVEQRTFALVGGKRADKAERAHQVSVILDRVAHCHRKLIKLSGVKSELASTFARQALCRGRTPAPLRSGSTSGASWAFHGTSSPRRA